MRIQPETNDAHVITIHGTLLLGLEVRVKCRLMQCTDMDTNRGWYCFFHMKGAAAFPMAYPFKMIALVTDPKNGFSNGNNHSRPTGYIRFVCPAVIIAVQDRKMTKGVIAKTRIFRVRNPFLTPTIATYSTTNMKRGGRPSGGKEVQ